MSDETDQPAGTQPKTHARQRLFHRVALVQTVLVVIAVIVALPIALRSMETLVTEQQSRTLYDFPSGQPATEEMAQVERAR